MSRIILSRYDDGEEHVVVGWDRPLNTFYYQEFNEQPDWSTLSDEQAEQWVEVLSFVGYMPGEITTTTDLVNHAATHSPVVFDTLLEVMARGSEGGPEVMVELVRHQSLDYPDSNVKLDLSNEETS